MDEDSLIAWAEKPQSSLPQKDSLWLILGCAQCIMRVSLLPQLKGASKYMIVNIVDQL